MLHIDSTLTQTAGASSVPAYLKYVDDSTFPAAGSNAPACNGTAAGSGDYDLADSQCIKSVKVQFIHGDACKLDGTYSITGITIGCGWQVAASDCPLQSASTATITFTVVSENFCASQATPNIIDNAITVDQFVAVDPDWLQYNTSDPHNNGTWRARQWNTVFFMRAHFVGLTVYQCTVRVLETDWFDDGWDVVYNTTAAAAFMTNTTIPIPAQYGRNSTPGHLGMDVDNQACLMAHMLDSTFAAGSDRASLEASNGPLRGQSLTLKVQVTIDVRYDNGSRRRRRAVAHHNPSVEARRNAILNQKAAHARDSSSNTDNNNNANSADMETSIQQGDNVHSLPSTGTAALGLVPQTVVHYGDDITLSNSKVPESAQRAQATNAAPCNVAAPSSAVTLFVAALVAAVAAAL